MSPTEDLRAILAGKPGHLYTVLDGAKYRDVRAVLRSADLFARSLFLEQPDRATVASSPFLLPLDASGLGRLLRIERIEIACVFWGGPVEESVVFRHLRSINRAEIPRPDSEADGPVGGGGEMVLFRHWDPSVLALALPIMEPAQRARLFGPLTQLVIYSTDAGRALSAAPRSDWPPAQRGWLKFSPVQMEQIADGMKVRSRRAIARYLRETAGPMTVRMNDAALMDFVNKSEAQALRWGIRTEAGFGRFAWLMLATGGRLIELPEARALVTTGVVDPDSQLRQLMSAVAMRLSAMSSAI
jgi:hypothetical protein